MKKPTPCPTCGHTPTIPTKAQIAAARENGARGGRPVGAKDTVRRVQITRDLPVRELTAEECRALMVHSHGCGPERRRAYLLTKAAENWEIYFTPSERAKVQSWIDQETR